MKATLIKLLKKECKKHITRYFKKINLQRRQSKYYSKRTNNIATQKNIDIPEHWNLDNTFNPFYVRANIECIAYTIAKKIKAGTYVPKPCASINIPKKGGGFRGITIFTIPDAVVSKYLYLTLLRRNYATFSSYAFAYRTDRNAHNAIEHLYYNIKDTPRSYILEYDFSKYFDTIGHDYILNLLNTNFKINKKELTTIKTLLEFSKAETNEDYKNSRFSKNSVGIPQGNSISLFLANIACFELDKEIERTGASFARFSDDSVIVCNDYSTAHKCANLMLAHGKRSGTKINFKKSDGISLLTQAEKAEISSKKSFDFLGHKISNKGISLSTKTINRIKSKISDIIHKNLIYYPSKFNIIPNTRYDEQNHTDWDLVTCLNEIRRYIYGRNITEKIIDLCLSDNKNRLIKTRCMMSFYPLVNLGDTFKNLDGWLCDTIYKALGKRASYALNFFPNYQNPSKQELIENSWYKNNLDIETQIPSFFKSWIYTRKLVKIYGIQKFPSPYYSESKK